MEKLLKKCCRLSREAWVVHTMSAKGQLVPNLNFLQNKELKFILNVLFHRKFQAKVGEYVNGNYEYGVHGGQMLQYHSKIVSEC